MKKKIIIVAAAVLTIIAGCVVMAVGFLMAGLDWRGLSSEKLVKDAEYIDGYFDSVNVRLSNSDLRLVLSQDGRCRAETSHHEKINIVFEIVNGELTVREIDGRKWTDHISIFTFGESYVTLYLTESAYKSAYLHTSTGDIDVSDNLSFEELNIKVTTGDVSSRAQVSKRLTVKGSTGSKRISGIDGCETVRLEGTTGDVTVSDVSCETLQLENSTSDIELRNIAAENITIGITTGDIDMHNVVASTLLEAIATTGDIEFDFCDGAEVVLKTGSGDVDGSLRTGKIFDVTTNTGRVRVPTSDPNGGLCKVNTNTGDVEIAIK